MRYLLILIALQPALAFAQPPAALPDRVTLGDVLKLLDERSPRTAAVRASVAVTAADKIAAEALPNPTVSYGGAHLVSGLSTGATTENQFLVEQPLLIFKQRQARLAAADENVNSEGARVAETLAGRRLAARQMFATLLSRQQQLEIVQRSLQNMERVAQLVQGRAAAGDRSQYDVLRVQIETETLRVQAMNAATDVEDAAGQLTTLLGLPGWSPRAAGTLSLNDVPTDMDVLWTSAERSRPSLVTLRRQQEAARGALYLADRERLPVPAINGGAQTTRNVNGTSIVFGFSLPLPLFDRNQGALARAAAQNRAADLAARAGLDEARAEIENAALVLTRRRESLEAFEGAVTERIPVLRRMAEDAYREGSADVLELLDANRSLKDAELSRVQQLEAAKLAEEALVAAAGLDEAPAP